MSSPSTRRRTASTHRPSPADSPRPTGHRGLGARGIAYPSPRSRPLHTFGGHFSARASVRSRNHLPSDRRVGVQQPLNDGHGIGKCGTSSSRRHIGNPRELERLLVRDGRGLRGLRVRLRLRSSSHPAQGRRGADRRQHGAHRGDHGDQINRVDEGVCAAARPQRPGRRQQLRNRRPRRRACPGRIRGARPGRRRAARRPRRAGRSPMPMLPRIAMPSAPPSSAPVSEMPDAAPARSGGADPTISSVVRVNTGARPSEMMTDADHDEREAGVSASTRVEHRRGRPPRAPSPPPITKAGRTRRDEPGREHRADDEPDRRGQRPQAGLRAATGRAPAAGTGR